MILAAKFFKSFVQCWSDGFGLYPDSASILLIQIFSEVKKNEIYPRNKNKGNFYPRFLLVDEFINSFVQFFADDFGVYLGGADVLMIHKFWNVFNAHSIV